MKGRKVRGRRRRRRGRKFRRSSLFLFREPLGKLTRLTRDLAFASTRRHAANTRLICNSGERRRFDARARPRLSPFTQTPFSLWRTRVERIRFSNYSATDHFRHRGLPRSLSRLGEHVSETPRLPLSPSDGTRNKSYSMNSRVASSLRSTLVRDLWKTSTTTTKIPAQGPRSPPRRSAYLLPRSCNRVATYARLHSPEGTLVVIVYRVVIHLAGNQHRTPWSTGLGAFAVHIDQSGSRHV